MRYFIALALITVSIVSCAPGSVLEDLSYEQAMDRALDACSEGDFSSITATFVQVNGRWHFKPCENCESQDLELYWGGNTGQHEPFVADLNQISEAYEGAAEISLLTFEQLSTAGGVCFYQGGPR